eukprot:6326201-Amphidinium_carterae.1
MYELGQEVAKKPHDNLPRKRRADPAEKASSMLKSPKLWGSVPCHVDMCGCKCPCRMPRALSRRSP